MASRGWEPIVCAVAVAASATWSGPARGQQVDLLDDAQVQYNRGRHVAPLYEGWFRNADGSIDMWFGYLNLNFEEVLHVPVGPENRVEPGGPDRGQPTVFVPRRRTGGAYQRRESFVFPVRLPADWKPKEEVVWTVTAHGRTDRAVGLLLPIYELSPPADDNLPPAARVSVTPERVVFPDSVTLTAVVSDDGRPQERRDRANVTWVHYRGPGKVTFRPARSPIPVGQPGIQAEVTTTASFSGPGTFVLRAAVNDGTTNAGGNPVVTSTTYESVTVYVAPGDDR